MYNKFKLHPQYIQKFMPEKRKPNFGFNGLGEIVYLRTYSRFNYEQNKNE